VEEKLKLFQETAPMTQGRSHGQRENENSRFSEQTPGNFQPADTTSSLAGDAPQNRQITSPEIEEDAVDGMGAVVLSDDEEEIGFFGKFPPVRELFCHSLI
jgi:hypothetical protein